ncbi:MAG TPA: sarcosine oxidase subunit gamma family protein [Steroidobacteraceae bacterium]|jgi:sarcosine oxidase subunit gamma
MPEVTLLSGLGRLSLRGTPAALAAAGAAFGLRLPEQACRAAEGDARAALWLGPDEQLLLVQQEVWPGVLAALGSGLRGMPHSLVDISQRQIALHIGGTGVTQLLNAGCPLDLHLQAFPVGMCTRTLLAAAPVVLWRTAAEDFHLEVGRALAPYLQQLLREVAREFEH